MIRKRKRDEDAHSDEKVNDGAQSVNQRHPKSRGQPKENPPRGWACPYFRWDPDEYYSCYERHTLTRFSDVIQHLERVHCQKRFYCPICLEAFEDSKESGGYISCKRCSRRLQPKPLFKDNLERFKDCFKNQLRPWNNKQRWHWVWGELFGPRETSDSPFIEPGLAEPAKILRQKNQPRLEEAIIKFIRSRGDSWDNQSLSNSLKGLMEIAYSISPGGESSRLQSLNNNRYSTNPASDKLHPTITEIGAMPMNLVGHVHNRNNMNNAVLQGTATMLALDQTFDQYSFQPKQPSLFDPSPSKNPSANGSDGYSSLQTSGSLLQTLDSSVFLPDPSQDVVSLAADQFISPEFLPGQVTTIPAMAIGVYAESSTIFRPALTQVELPPSYVIDEHDTNAIGGSKPDFIDMSGGAITPPYTSSSTNILWNAGQTWSGNNSLSTQNPFNAASGFAPSDGGPVADERDRLASPIRGNHESNGVVPNMTAIGNYCWHGMQFDL